jgi:hypothetical protein
MVTPVTMDDLVLGYMSKARDAKSDRPSGMAVVR